MQEQELQTSTLGFGGSDSKWKYICIPILYNGTSWATVNGTIRNAPSN
jgi:hypothetical protein